MSLSILHSPERFRSISQYLKPLLLLGMAFLFGTAGARAQTLEPNPGAYRGLGTSTVTGLRKGLLSLELSRTGSFTASFRRVGTVQSFSGKFAGGEFDLSKKNFTVALSGSADLISGTITLDGTASYVISANRNVFTKLNPAPETRYTLFFPPPSPPNPAPSGFPQGYSWATAHVMANGDITVAGHLGDTTGHFGFATSFSSGGFIFRSGSNFQYSLYSEMYGNLYMELYAKPDAYGGKRGEFAGILTLTAPSVSATGSGISDVSGTIAWAKPTEHISSWVVNPAFDVNVTGTGSLYFHPPAGERVLPGLNAVGNAEIDFSAGLLASTLKKTIVISNGNHVTPTNLAGPFDELSLSFNATNGSFHGVFLSTTFFPNYTGYAGVVLQNQKFGRGNFPGATVNTDGAASFAGGEVLLYNPNPAP